MKIGIVTFPRAINYGTSLQAVALRKVLIQGGNEVAFCEHACKCMDASNALFDIKQVTDMKYTVAHLCNLPTAWKRKRAFQDFWKRWFQFSAQPLDTFDAVVTGSDQVWNYHLTDSDMFYYLDFKKSHAKKVAYAASFGLSGIPQEQYSTLRPLLEDFDYLSVREETATEIVRDICSKDIACTVLDPTLLLNKAQWAEMSDLSIQDKGYIFVYTVFNSDTLWDFAQQLSKKTGLPIKTVGYSRFHRHDAQYSLTAGPAQWLSHMLGADYVVTNSFHGMAFSVNFQKNFYYELPPSSSGVGSRLADMAKKYGLQERGIGKAAPEASIDWEHVALALEEDRRSSMAFVQSFIQK